MNAASDKRRCVCWTMLIAVGVTLFGVPWEPVAAQKYGELAGCSDEPLRFQECARAKAKEFNPPRTPDGKPDFQGYWSRAGVSAPTISRSTPQDSATQVGKVWLWTRWTAGSTTSGIFSPMLCT